jgi:hypothetical protein
MEASVGESSEPLSNVGMYPEQRPSPESVIANTIPTALLSDDAAILEKLSVSQPSIPVATIVEITDNSEVHPARPDFAMGDHVYQWCSWAGIPFAYAHHGIVLEVFFNENEKEWTLRIVDFSNWTMEAVMESDEDDYQMSAKKKTLRYSDSGMFSTTPGGCVRTYESSYCTWRKVEYGVSGFLKQHLSRSGTCTSAESSPAGLVRTRVQFLLDHPEYLPPYSMVQSNCECVAVWCKTGTWATTQATSFLTAMAAGQAKSAVTLAGVAASTQVTVPAAGLWGWLGYTTTTSFVAANPLVLPMIAAYGVVTVVAPSLWLWKVKDKWSKLTVELNEAFWTKYALEQPEAFAECLTEWSTQCAQDA